MLKTSGPRLASLMAETPERIVEYPFGPPPPPKKRFSRETRPRRPLIQGWIVGSTSGVDGGEPSYSFPGSDWTTETVLGTGGNWYIISNRSVGPGPYIVPPYLAEGSPHDQGIRDLARKYHGAGHPGWESFLRD